MVLLFSVQPQRKHVVMSLCCKPSFSLLPAVFQASSKAASRYRSSALLVVCFVMNFGQFRKWFGVVGEGGFDAFFVLSIGVYLSLQGDRLPGVVQFSMRVPKLCGFSIVLFELAEEFSNG